MNRILAPALLALALAASPAAAGGPVLTPANPQPTDLKPGLAVEYAYPADVKSLSQADSWRSHGVEKGEPLVGFDYIDTLKGEKTLTSKRAEFVVAWITGYMRFDAAGTHKLEFHNNDGLEVEIGGQQVYKYDGRHPCETGGWVEVEVPEPGWYPVKALFFQRYNTSCLMLQWEPPGESMDWAPTDIYGYAE